MAAPAAPAALGPLELGQFDVIANKSADGVSGARLRAPRGRAARSPRPGAAPCSNCWPTSAPSRPPAPARSPPPSPAPGRASA